MPSANRAAAGLGEVDLLLLRAALLEGGPARAAYGALRARLDLDALDYGRQRLLPLLHRNLTRFGVDDPELGRLRGIRHYHWAKNQVRVKAFVPVLKALHAAGVPTMLLKGSALLATSIEDMSLRPMDDVDVLVPYAQRAAAVEVLTRSGYEPFNAPAWCIADAMRDLPGHAFSNAAKHEIDLHWHVLHLDMRPEGDDTFWRRSRKIDFAGAPTSVLDPADQVLHLMSHGARWNEISTLRWAADAMIVLRGAGPGFAWDQLVREACARRLAPPIYVGLLALKAHLDLDVPAGVFGALKRHSSQFARLEHRLRATPTERLSRLARFYLEVCDFRRRRAGFMERSLAVAVVPYLRDRLNARGTAALAALVIFAGPGRPRLLRRLLRFDRWARRFDVARLPHLGTTIDAESGSATVGAFLDGWSHPEPAGRWSTRREARLAWRPPEGWRSDLACEIEAWGFRSPRAPAPEIDIWANDRHVARWYTDCHGLYRTQSSFVIPGAAVAGAAAIVVSLAVQRVSAPVAAAVSLDPRPLGVFVRRIKVVPALGVRPGRYRPPPSRLAQYCRDRFGARDFAALVALKAFDALGRPPALRGPLHIDRWARFADPERLPSIDDAFPPATPAARDPCLEGWGLPEPGGRWTVAREARAAWRLPREFAGELECEIAGWTLTKPGLPPPAITIRANDCPIVHRTGGPGEIHAIDRRLRIPAAAMRGAETLVLAFAVEPLRSPAELGLSADARSLGLFLERVRFRRPAA